MPPQLTLFDTKDPKIIFLLLEVCFSSYSTMTSSSVCLFAAENKPIWMHAEEREEMSKVRRPCVIYTKNCQENLQLLTRNIKSGFASV